MLTEQTLEQLVSSVASLRAENERLRACIDDVDKALVPSGVPVGITHADAIGRLVAERDDLRARLARVEDILVQTARVIRDGRLNDTLWYSDTETLHDACVRVLVENTAALAAEREGTITREEVDAALEQGVGRARGMSDA